MKQQKLKRVVIKEELVQLTQHRDEALILNQFLYWTPKTVDYIKFVKEETEGDGTVNHGWIYKKSEELIDELMLVGMNVKTIRKHLVSLVDKGYLLRRRNPIKKYDKTYQYRINLKRIKADLDTLGYELEGYQECMPKLNKVAGQNGSSKVTMDAFEGDKKDVRKSKMSAAIPEITNKEYNSNNELKKEIGDSVDDISFKKIKDLYLKLSTHDYLLPYDEAAINNFLSKGINTEITLKLMNDCYQTAMKMKKKPNLYSFEYFRNFIEGTLKEQNDAKDMTDNAQPKTIFVGDTTADF